MYARPAGMSDDEDDYGGFSFADEVPDIHDQYEKPDYIVRKTEPVVNCKDSYSYNSEQSFKYDIANACKVGDVKVIEKYLENHNVNEFLTNGWTALLYASLYGQPDVIDCLLKHGAKPNKHKDGFTPLMALCTSTEDSSDKTISCLKLLLDAKANANTFNRNRETALMLACKMKDIDLIAELLPHVKCINACDRDGRTALMYAVAANKPDVVKLLLENHANPNIPDRYNRTVKDIAAQKEFKEILRLFNDESVEEEDVCQISNLYSWKDLFPKLSSKNYDVVDRDIATMLRGMGLASYMHLFKGMDVNTFLQLTEKDLINLGIDISFHRKQFMECLHIFHTKRWTIQSLGTNSKSEQYTIYDGVLTLGTAAKQMTVIESSFRYVKNGLRIVDEEGIDFTSKEKLDYEEELKKTQDTLFILKQELLKIKELAKKIDKESDTTAPPSFITPKHNNTHSTIILSITVMVGIFLSRNIYTSWLCNK